MLKYQKELENLLTNSAKDLEAARQEAFSRMKATEDMFKAEKHSFERKHKEEISVLK